MSRHAPKPGGRVWYTMTPEGRAAEKKTRRERKAKAVQVQKMLRRAINMARELEK